MKLFVTAVLLLAAVGFSACAKPQKASSYPNYYDRANRASKDSLKVFDKE